MVGQITAAFDRRIEALDWMTPETKAQARGEGEEPPVSVGYPSAGWTTRRWRSPAETSWATWSAPPLRLPATAALLGKPVDRGDWCMEPQTVNAVNLPLHSALNFPAAILEPPFFDPRAPAAVNYGGIGTVIGHEVSHSFDDQGAMFDSDGRLRNWWTPADFAKFEQSGTRLAAQFDAYRPFPDLHVNGKLTLSENIADVAGIAAAYDGWRASLGGKEPP
jgi:predicted metalloendopeptidase